MLPTSCTFGTLLVLGLPPPPLTEALSEFSSACWELTHDMFYLQSRRQSGKRMTNISRYLVEVSLSFIFSTEYSDRGGILTRSFAICRPLFLCTAPADVLTPGWRCPGCGGGAGSPFLPGSEQEAVEPTDVPGCRSRGHLPERHPEPGEDTDPCTPDPHILTQLI